MHLHSLRKACTRPHVRGHNRYLRLEKIVHLPGTQIMRYESYAPGGKNARSVHLYSRTLILIASFLQQVWNPSKTLQGSQRDRQTRK